MQSHPIDLLTRREREVLAMFSCGMTSKTIAAELVLSPLTVQAHAKSIYRKLKVTNRVQAVLLYRESAPLMDQNE